VIAASSLSRTFETMPYLDIQLACWRYWNPFKVNPVAISNQQTPLVAEELIGLAIKRFHLILVLRPK
jgi:hypothetical protein